MYNLDINFLRDRNLGQTANITSGFVQKKEASFADKIPIIGGAFVFLLAPAITFGYLQSVKAKTVAIESEIKQIESEIAELGNQNKKLEAAEAEIKAAEAETAAFVQVFEKIKPWAAIMQEISDRTPPGVQVDSIQQSGAAATGSDTGDAATATVGAVGVNLSGVARSYEDVNDFVLFLQRSPFFERQQVKLNGASSADFAVEVANREDFPDIASLELPGVKYTISAQLNNAPSSELIQVISEKGSIGVVTRLKTLERINRCSNQTKNIRA